MPQSYTLEQLQQMGATPRSYTLEELQQMGAKPSAASKAQENVESLKAIQAAKYPTKEKAGVDTSSYINNLAGSLYSATSLFHSPLQFASAVPRMAKDFMESGASQQMARLAKGEPLADPTGIGQVAEPALAGDIPGALGAATGMGVAMAAPWAIGKAVPPIASGIRSGATALNVPERLMTGAASARQMVQKPPSVSIPTTGAGALVQGAKAVAGPVVRGGARMAERAARELATQPEIRPVVSSVDPVAPKPASGVNMDPQAQFNPMGVKPKLPQGTPVQRIERGLAPSGTRAKASTLKNAPRLSEVAPELADIPPGPQFDAALMDTFRRVEQGVDMAQSQLPPTTKVLKAPIIEKWGELVDLYQAEGRTPQAAQMTKLVQAWKELPDQIPWEQFVPLKRAMGTDMARSVPLRRAYQALMDETTKLSEGLAEANRRYSIVRRSLDDAKIDPITGRRIMEVGKKLK